MRRFNYDDSDDQDEVDKFSDFGGDDDDDDNPKKISDEEWAAIAEQQANEDALALMHLDMISSELDQKLLMFALRACQKSWFWSFRSWAGQMRRLTKTYNGLDRILNNMRLKKQKEGNE